MREWIIVWLPWILSIASIYKIHALGKKYKWVWLYAMVLMSFWCVWMVAAEAWGFLPLNTVQWILFIKNHREWNKKEKNNELG